VVRVAKTVLTSADVSAPVSLQQPAYKVSVRLDRQDVTALGERVPLRPDMLLRADILLDRRPLLTLASRSPSQRDDLLMLQSLVNFSGRRRSAAALEEGALAKENKMKQMSQVRKPAKVRANPALDQVPARPMATIGEADLDKVSRGNGTNMNGDI